MSAIALHDRSRSVLFPETKKPLPIQSFDFETWKFRAGIRAPRPICASTAWVNSDGQVVGDLLPTMELALDTLESLLAWALSHPPCGCPGSNSASLFPTQVIYHVEECPRPRIAFANAAYDLAVAAEHRPRLFRPIFRALRLGIIHDVLIGESLHAIYGGHLGLSPHFQPLVHPSTGEVVTRYSLALSVYLTLGREDAKKNDIWRESYAFLEGIPRALWPYEAEQYPIDDAVNTLEDAIAQIVGKPGDHLWQVVPNLPGDVRFVPDEICANCGLLWSESPYADAFSPPAGPCPKASWVRHRNSENHPAQVDAALARHLGSCHGLRTDPDRVEKLIADAEEKNKVAVARFQKKGWIREDGSEDQSAVKRALALAYGAKVPCLRCMGKGVIRPTKVKDCRGEKVRGRYRGCEGPGCAVCSGVGTVEYLGDEKACKNVFDEGGALVEEGCDGTGFDLSQVPLLRRSPKTLGVSTDRDSKKESGDEDLADYGEDEFQKTLTTYAPYLKTGTKGPLDWGVDILKATGRASVEGPLFQMPRAGGERECVRARGAWCNYPIEMCIGSTDYSAGELCTLAQLCFWLFGYSYMRDAIVQHGKPGILHSDFAAAILGIPLDDFLARQKAKDKQATDFRQAAKAGMFGFPGGMGTPKFVLTKRRKNEGFTPCERGPAKNHKGVRGYWGIRFCILTGGAEECGTEKITAWGRNSYPCAPVCKACCDVVEHVLRPVYAKKYPEVAKDYFKWGSKKIDKARDAGAKVVLAPVAVWDPNEGAPRIVFERGIPLNDQGVFSTLLNNGFQAMLSVIGKHADARATRECYLGEKEDGTPSPLYGSRVPLYIHDESLSELILETAHLSGPRLAEINVESGKMLAPDVVWEAETAIAPIWSKGMESVYDQNGKLILWTPDAK